MTAKPETALQEARRLTRELRQRMQDEAGAEGFTQAEYVSRLEVELSHLRPALYSQSVLKLADDEDRVQAKTDCKQPTLFDLGGEFHILGGKRVARRNASFVQALEMMRLDDENLEKVKEANRRKHEDLERLRPFWSVPGTSLRRAIDAYNEAHPDAPMPGGDDA